MAFPPRTLYARLVVVLSAVIMAAFVAFGIVIAEKEAAVAERMIRSQSEVITRNIAESSAHHLLVWDYAGLEEILIRFSELSAIHRLQATEPDGAVLSDIDGQLPVARAERDRIPVPGEIRTTSRIEGENLIIWHPIAAGSHLGWIKATFGLRELAEIKEAVWRNTAFLAVLFITASTGLILFVIRRPVLQIQRLSRFARSLNSEKGSKLPAERSALEIEELCDSLNRASRDLDESDRRLIAERERLAVTLHSIGDGVIATDTRGEVVLVNRIATELTGWTSADAAGKPLAEVFRIIDEETRLPIENPVRKVLTTGQIVGLSNHAALISRDGTERSIADSGAPIVDATGAIVGVVLVFRDVTREKRAEQLIRSIFESIGEGLIVIGRDYKIQSANRAFARQAGKSLAEVIGKHCYGISHHRESPCGNGMDGACPAKRTFETGEPAIALHMHGPDIRHASSVETRTFPLRDASGAVVSVIETITDITDRKQLEEQLRQAQKMEAVGQLAGGIAHDFNNILTAIIGYGNLVLHKTGTDETLRFQVQQVLSAAERAARLTGSLLAFSRKQAIEMKPVHLSEIVKSIHKLLLRLIGEDIELRVLIDAEKSLIMADSGQMEQVLMNLATNARDAMPRGGILTLETGESELDERTCREHGFDKPGKYTVLSVSDTGTGMDESIRTRIFDPFFTTKETGKGTGLGLAIVYGIVKQHGGSITVYSEPGKGTTFKLYFPVFLSGDEKPGLQQTIEAPRGGTETILLAEDDDTVRKLIQAILEDSGYRVIAAADGEEAVRLFRMHGDGLHLVITDVVMPRKNGKEVYDEIRVLRPEIKAIFISGYTADIIKSRGILEDGTHYLPKPILPDDLLRKVRAVLDGP